MNLHGLKKHKKEIVYEIEQVEGKIRSLSLNIETLMEEIRNLRAKRKFLTIKKHGYSNKIGAIRKGQNEQESKKYK